MRDRLARAVRLWREATDAPLPRLHASEPGEKMAAFEHRLVELLVARADPGCAADVQCQLAELVEGRPSDDAVRGRVESVLPMLRRLDGASVTIPADPALAADVLADTLGDALTEPDPGDESVDGEG